MVRLFMALYCVGPMSLINTGIQGILRIGKKKPRHIHPGASHGHDILVQLVHCPQTLISEL